MCNNTAPLFIKNKSTWINKERERWASQFSIPVRQKVPRTFPVSTVNAMRALVALQMDLGADRAEDVAKVVEVLWAMLWNPDAVTVQELRDEGGKGDFDVKSVEQLKALMGTVVGGDVAERVMARIGEKDVKDQLSENTKKAFEAGAFGLPWFHCVNSKGEEEGFWGFDHLGQVCRFLGLDAGKLDNSGNSKQVRALL